MKNFFERIKVYELNIAIFTDQHPQRGLNHKQKAQ